MEEENEASKHQVEGTSDASGFARPSSRNSVSSMTSEDQVKQKRKLPMSPDATQGKSVNNGPAIDYCNSQLKSLRKSVEEASAGYPNRGLLLSVLEQMIGIMKRMAKEHRELDELRSAPRSPTFQPLSKKPHYEPDHDSGVKADETGALKDLQEKLQRQEERLTAQDAKLDKLISMMSAEQQQHQQQPAYSSSKNVSRGDADLKQRHPEVKTCLKNTLTENESAMETDGEAWTLKSKKKLAKRKPVKERLGNPTTPQPVEEAVTAKVHPRKLLKKPPAVLIKNQAGSSYADTVRLVRMESGISTVDIASTLSSMRKTKDGHLIMEFKNGADAEVVAKKVVTTLTENLADKIGQVSQLGISTEIEIRDIDIIATREEVHAAILRSISEQNKDEYVRSDVAEITGMWSTSRGGQIATVRVPRSVAMKLEKVAIGWTMCRVRPRLQVERCFRCHGYGHTNRDCKGPDLSAACRRCGETGHHEKTCITTEKCVACDRAGLQRAAHKPGTGGCAAKRAAVSLITANARQ